MKKKRPGMSHFFKKKQKRSKLMKSSGQCQKHFVIIILYSLRVVLTTRNLNSERLQIALKRPTNQTWKRFPRSCRFSTWSRSYRRCRRQSGTRASDKESENCRKHPEIKFAIILWVLFFALFDYYLISGQSYER